MKPKSYYKIIFDQFWCHGLNRLGVAVVLFMLMSAVFADFFAGSKPIYYVDNGKTVYPVMETIFDDLRSVADDHKFLSFLHTTWFDYNSYEQTNFKKLSQEPNQKLLIPVIPYSPTEYDLDSVLLPPSARHFMGTDDQGRDVAARMLHGARISLSVGFVAVGIYVVLGIIIGAIAGFFGGRVDMVISRIMEVVMCFPTFFLILAVLAFIGPSLFNIMVVIGLTEWTGIARLVRGEFLKLKTLDYVTSARALGVKTPRLIFRHILPNSLSSVLVSVTFGVASAVLTESSLSFLGFGVQPPTPSWGDILSQSRDFMDIAWWLMVFPGVAIFVTITAFNLVGEGLRDAIDPRA